MPTGKKTPSPARHGSISKVGASNGAILLGGIFMIPKNNVKKIRLAQGLSGLELSRRARIAPSTLHNIENRKIVAFPGWRRRIAEALGVPEDEIFPEGVKSHAANGK